MREALAVFVLIALLGCVLCPEEMGREFHHIYQHLVAGWESVP
jgi:hypothetical protein